MKWGSDVVAEVARRLNLKYIALVPGASYRGFHDSIVNYLGNTNPQMVICLHVLRCLQATYRFFYLSGRPRI